MSQQENSRAAVDRLLDDLAAADDQAQADGLAGQIRLHAELAGLSPDELAGLVQAKAGPVKPTKTVKPAEA